MSGDVDLVIIFLQNIIVIIVMFPECTDVSLPDHCVSIVHVSLPSPAMSPHRIRRPLRVSVVGNNKYDVYITLALIHTSHIPTTLLITRVMSQDSKT